MSKSTRFCWCLYEAMSKPHNDILACVFCNCLKTSSSSAGVCWMDLFKASIGLLVSKCGGFEVSPSIYRCLTILLGFEVFFPIYGRLVCYLGFEVFSPICRCWVVLEI